MMTTPTILVVDDEARSQRFLASSLAAAGYECLPARSGAEALELIATRAPAIVLVSSELPDIAGGELIRRVRGWSNIPIIMLSGRRDAEEEVTALDRGADDYVGKPFDFAGLLARIRKALRQQASAKAEPSIFSAGGVVVDPISRIVTRDKVPVRLTAREFDVLLFLMRHAGHVLTHRQILEAVWDQAHGGHIQSLRVFIGRLRQKIETRPEDPKLLVTVQGVGYRLAGPH
jgi:two-component system KDP operon response regulator KdpE